MYFITNSENGRIYIKKKEVEKIVYNYVKDNEPKLRIYDVKYDLSRIQICFFEQSAIEIERIYQLQNDIKKYLDEDLGLYIEKINIKLG